MTDWHPQFLELGINQTKSETQFIVSRKLLNKIIMDENEICNPAHNLTGLKWGYTSYSTLKKIGYNTIFDHTLSTLGRSFYQVFEDLNYWGEVVDQSSQKKGSQLQRELTSNFENPEVCRRLGKKAKECQKAKFDLIQSAQKIDDSLLTSSQEYYERRISYGSCQTLWASKAEEFLHKK